MGLDLRCRRRQAELMDQPDLEQAPHDQALRGLARINWWSRSASILWPAIRALSRRLDGAPLRLLDVACGAGDVAIRLWHKARRAGVLLQIDGCDISPAAVAFASRRAAAAGADVRFFTCDALSQALPDSYDVVSTSLFLHHLEEEQAVALLRQMSSAARHLVLINDLRRSWRGFMLAWLATRVLTRSPIVHFDGPRSVESAFTAGEALQLGQHAGLGSLTVTHRWPFRFLLQAQGQNHSVVPPSMAASPEPHALGQPRPLERLHHQGEMGITPPGEL